MSDQSPHATANCPHANTIINDLGGGILTKFCCDCGCKDFTECAAPMVADPAGVAMVDCIKCEGRGRYAVMRDGLTIDGRCTQCNGAGKVAATVKAVPKIRITLRQARRLVDFFGGHDADVTVTERATVWEQIEEGLYAFCTEYPEDGAQFLGATEVDDELMRLGTVNAVPSEALDTKRLDWLMANNSDYSVKIRGQEKYGWFIHDPWRDISSSYFSTSREAIDAAIAAPLADKTGGGE